jgi:hypothetical protein
LEIRFKGSFEELKVDEWNISKEEILFYQDVKRSREKKREFEEYNDHVCRIITGDVSCFGTF